MIHSILYLFRLLTLKTRVVDTALKMQTCRKRGSVYRVTPAPVVRRLCPRKVTSARPAREKPPRLIRNAAAISLSDSHVIHKVS